MAIARWASRQCKFSGREFQILCFIVADFWRPWIGTVPVPCKMKTRWTGWWQVHSQPVARSGSMTPITHTSTSLAHVLSPLAKLPNTSTSRLSTSGKARAAQARTLQQGMRKAVRTTKRCRLSRHHSNSPLDPMSNGSTYFVTIKNSCFCMRLEFLGHLKNREMRSWDSPGHLRCGAHLPGPLW